MIRTTRHPRLLKTRLGPWEGGINENAHPSALPPNKARKIQNFLVDEEPGSAVQRFGYRKVSTLPSGNAARDGYIFQKADGTAYFLASDGEKLYYTTDPSVQANWTLLKSGLNSDGFMEFETAENKVWMTNGVDPIMSWDGTTLVVYDRTYTSTTNAAAVTGTTIDHAGLTEADDYWIGQKLVFTVGANVGTVVTITDFDAANDRLTFTPAVTGAAVTDRWVLGLDLFIARAVRYWDGHLWFGSTTDNGSELRYNRLTDQDTGADITIDNPRAWPAANQLDVYSQDGDRVWGLSPVCRDRILAHKSTGLFRLERDPLTTYRVEVVDRAVGSRFPRSWAIKRVPGTEGLLYFIGQDKDRLPEAYRTDMVSVQLVDPDQGVYPTLKALKQPNTVQQSISLAATADFDAGDKSTLVKTDNGKIEVGGFDTNAKWNTYVSKSNLVVGNVAGSVDILGIPTWEARYEGTAIPTSSDPAWSQVGTSQGLTESAASSILSLTHGGDSTVPYYQRKRASVLDSAKDAYLCIRARCVVASNAQTVHFGLWNGSKGVYIELIHGTGVRINGSTTVAGSVDSFAFYHLLLKSDGTYKLWKDGSLISSGSAGTTSLNKVQMGLGTKLGGVDPLVTDADAFAGAGGSAMASSGIEIDKLYYQSDLKDSAIPDTIPTSGTIVVPIDYTRTPDALLRIYATATLNGGTIALRSWTSGSSTFTSDNDTGYVSVANGAAPTSAVKRHQRIELTVTRADLSEGPQVTNLQTGILWRSGAQFIGAAIASWRTFLATLTTPAGTDQTIKIRRATVSTTPVEGDWGAWVTIANGNNIGTILSDATPPDTRWVDLKVEQGPSSAGAVPDADALVIQWNEGSEKILPLQGIVHKGRWLIAGASNTASTNDTVVVSDRKDAWVKFTGWNLNWMGHFQGKFYGFDSTSDKIFELDVDGVYDDNGTTVTAIIETREEAPEEELRKDLRFSYLHVGDIACTITADYKRPGDSDWTGSKSVTTDTTSKDHNLTFSAATLAKRFQRRYQHAEAGKGCKLRGETIYYATRGAQRA